MAAPAKFLFDNDFAAQTRGKPQVSLADHAVKLKEAETAGYATGFAAAQAEAKVSVERQTVVVLERIAAAIDSLKGNLEATHAQLEGEAVEVAVAVGRKLASELIAREPFAEIAALAANCFQHLVAAPHVVVRVADAQQTVAISKLDALVRTRGLESRLVVLSDPEIAVGDCRIEWADGGMARNRAAIEAAVDESVGRYLGPRRTPHTTTLEHVNWSNDR